MSESLNQAQAAAPEPKARIPYHTPRIEDYGAANDLTGSAVEGALSGDGTTAYSSIP